ncbi:MAG: TIGR03560 family F420-dependent LLM class oxidoreductase [Thermomicrobiales bacterium]|nr:TIGR03560 family F420-dependent LLM class oxidoreductase [Thermomicrobiales bacterium]
MVRLGIMIEGQEGLTWERWQRIVRAGEDFGYDSVWRSDHLYSVMAEVYRPTLALVPSLTAAAIWSERVELGALVSPTTFRHPVHLATEAAALDQLTGGRYWFGVGAGWNEAEHHAFGFQLPNLGERMDRFEEALQVITLLWTGEVVSFNGVHFQLRNAQAASVPVTAGGVPMIIGGSGERRTLRIVAKYAAEWNVSTMTVDAYDHKRAVLAEHCRTIGRDPETIRQSMMLGHVIGRDEREVLDRARKLQEIIPSLRDVSAAEALDRVRQRGYLAGTVDEVIEQARERGRQGVERIMLQTYDQDDIDGLKLIADEVAPNI